MPVIRGRLRRSTGEPDPRHGDVVEIDTSDLAGVFAAPRWLRDAGSTSWLLVGITVLLAGAVWLLTLTAVIVVPVITASVIAAVAGPLVSWMARHRIPRALGAILVLLLIVAVGLLAGYLVLNGVSSESSAISGHLDGAVSEIESGLESAGVDSGKADSAGKDLSSGATNSVQGMLDGVLGGIAKLSSLVFFVAMTILSLVFLLKDGPTIRAWAERHSGVPADVARTVSGRVLESLRGYFLGVTIVAAFNAVLVGGGALLLGVPLAGTIAIVTLLGAYVPYLGAWTAGAFSVLLALGGAGPEAAGGMVVIQILSNGPFQQVVQPIAYGAALGLHPLAVLIATIAGGALFGAVGLILAAPLTSAVARIAADLGRSAGAKEAETKRPAETGGPAPAPG